MYRFAYCLHYAGLKEYTQKLCKKAEATRSVSVTKSRHFKKPTYACTPKSDLPFKTWKPLDHRIEAWLFQNQRMCWRPETIADAATGKNKCWRQWKIIADAATGGKEMISLLTHELKKSSN